jgi:hypothetical protein
MNKYNFFISSMGIFIPIDGAKLDVKNADFVSGEGEQLSYYFYSAESLIRVSKHWGMVSKCVWLLNGMVEDTHNCVILDHFVAAKINWDSLSWLKEMSARDIQLNLQHLKSWRDRFVFDPAKPHITLEWLNKKIIQQETILMNAQFAELSNIDRLPDVAKNKYMRRQKRLTHINKKEARAEIREYIKLHSVDGKKLKTTKNTKNDKRKLGRLHKKIWRDNFYISQKYL